MHTGARISIEETARYHDQKTTVKRLSYDHEIGDVLEQAYQYLTKRGFKVVSRASETKHYYLLADSWGSNFIEL